MCGICAGTMNSCPACGGSNAPTHESWADRLDSRRHQGSHVTPMTAGIQRKPLQQGRYTIDTGGMKPGYYSSKSRGWNSRYDGPGKGTW